MRFKGISDVSLNEDLKKLGVFINTRMLFVQNVI